MLKIQQNFKSKIRYRQVLRHESFAEMLQCPENVWILILSADYFSHYNKKDISNFIPRSLANSIPVAFLSVEQNSSAVIIDARNN